jgi:hypothetical protein
MSSRWRSLMNRPAIQWTMFVLGLLLMCISPILGPIPGPGGLPIFVAGLVLVLRSSMWAKRHYARIKKRRVKFARWDFIIGDWTDWALRRPSAKRRKAIQKAADQGNGS